MIEALLIALRSTFDEWLRTRWRDLQFSDARTALLVFVVLAAIAALVLFTRAMLGTRAGRTHITLPSACGRQVRRGVRSHYRSQRGGTTLRRGLPISTPEQTFLDLAGIGVGLVDLVVVADGMIKEGHTSPDRLIEAAEQWRGKGCRVARRAALLAREGVDSPQETRLRLLLVLAGLPEPRVNVVIRGGMAVGAGAKTWRTNIFG